MFDDPAVLKVATRRTLCVAWYRVLIGLLAVAALSGAVGWMLCIDDPDSFFAAAAAGILTLALAALDLRVVARRKLADPVYLAFGSCRSALPCLRGPSAGAGLALVRGRPGRASSDAVLATQLGQPNGSQ